jgi:hypothetical protein
VNPSPIGCNAATTLYSEPYYSGITPERVFFSQSIAEGATHLYFHIRNLNSTNPTALNFTVTRMSASNY